MCAFATSGFYSMDLKDFWYVVAESRHLKKGKALSAKVLGEWIAVFRGTDGKPVALIDRCLHRCSQISHGKVSQGQLHCPYHGWVYNHEGRVTHVPEEGPDGPRLKNRRTQTFETCEVDDYVYVKLKSSDREPFRIPCYRHKGFNTIRLVNRFMGNVTNCTENFVNIPHTVFVHPGIFRTHKRERFGATIERKQGSVYVNYQNERGNFGLFSWFLNPSKREIIHTDQFHMPNVTTVNYQFGPSWRFIITSQSVPVNDNETIVYTDLTYNYGMFNKLAVPIIKWQAQTIINQDIQILGNQARTLQKYDAHFATTPSDMVYVYIDAIRKELEQGNDPTLLPDKKNDIEFWV
jgi:phenylpropionate dioxygenase-like ring-hydroxylating dioxygenase large terminal subunit